MRRRCFIKRPPVFANRCCKLVSDHLSIRIGSASRRHRFPRLLAITLRKRCSTHARHPAIRRPIARSTLSTTTRSMRSRATTSRSSSSNLPGLGLATGLEYNSSKLVQPTSRDANVGPLQMRGLIMFLPQFARVFWHLMADKRVSVITEAVPFLGVFALISPALRETQLHPHHRRARLAPRRNHLLQNLRLAVPGRYGARARKRRGPERLAAGGPI